jgi:60 kDa SS-A/Ro ribonucleoprotein
MSRIAQTFGAQNPTTRGTTRADTVNREGLPAFERPLAEKYLQLLLTNTLGNVYYATAESQVREAEALHAEMAGADPEYMGRALAYARNKGYMRSNPVYGLAVLAGVDGPHFREAFDRVILTPGDLADFMVILGSLRQGQGGRKVKRVVGAWLLARLTEYWAIKYGSTRERLRTGKRKKGEPRARTKPAARTYTLRDTIKTTHPDFGGRSHEIISYLLHGLPEETGEWEKSLPQLRAFEALKRAGTDAERVRLIEAGRVPHEQASSFATSGAVWRAIVPQLPTFALLKNLATLERHALLDERVRVRAPGPGEPAEMTVRDFCASRLDNADAIRNSKLLPYRFIDALGHVKDARLKDLVRAAADHSVANLPEIEGTTDVFLDISGSMDGDIIKKAAIFGVSLAQRSRGDSKFYTFNAVVEEVPVSRRDSMLTQAERIHASGTTATYKCMELLVAQRRRVDNVILITDEQQNRLGETWGRQRTFFDYFDDYRRDVNRAVRLFIVNVGSYIEGGVAPLDDPGVHFIYGWSPNVISYISLSSQGFGGMSEALRGGAL